VFFRVLGGLQVEVAGGEPLDLGGRKQRIVLAALLLAEGRAIAAGALAERVWLDHLPERHEGSLQAYVSNLRRILEPGRRPRSPATVLVSRPAGYAMALDVDSLDLTRFDAAARGARLRFEAGDTAAAAALLDEAARLWRGAVLPEFEGLDWVDEPAVRATELWRSARLDRLDIHMALGESTSLVAEAEQLVAEYPYDERAHASLALVRYRAGRQRDALAGLAEARRILVEDIGVEPGLLLRQLQQDILEQAAHLDLPAPGRSAAVDDVSSSPVIRSPDAHRVVELRAPVDVASFHGRTAELERLVRRGPVGGSGDVVVISGEAGAGKTRLVEEYLRLTEPGIVAWGRCPENASQSAYWVWSQILRQLEGLGGLGDRTVEELLGGDNDGTSDVRPSGSASRSDPLTDATADRRAVLHRAVCEALTAAPRPMTLVFDDLQWADAASLQLLVDVCGQLRRLPVRLLVTTRPRDDLAVPELADALSELGRHTSSMRLDLSGLDREAIRAWLEHRSGAPPAAATVAAVVDRTGGNAFFVGEMVDLLAAGAAASSVPSAVHGAVRRRVDRLPDDCQTVLTIAALVGREFHSAVLAEIEDLPPLEVIDRLQPAIDHGLLEEGDQPGVVRFAHAIVAEALSTEMSVAQRARGHAHIAEVLVARGVAANPHRVPEVAFHAYHGMAAGTAALALEWSRRAAEDAERRLGDEDAVVHWGRALEALEVASPSDRTSRLELLIERGRALLRLDDIGDGAPCLVEAMLLAIELHDMDQLERAVHALDVSSSWQSGEVGSTVDVVAALESALHVLPPERRATRALALALMADFGYWTRPADQCAARADEAVEIARSLDEPVLLMRVLNKKVLTVWHPSSFPRRVAAIEELLQGVAADAPPSLRAIAMLQRATLAWELGDVAMAQRLIDRVQLERPDSVVVNLQAKWSHAALLLWRGQLHAAAQAVEQGLALFRRTRRWGADEFGAAYMVFILIEQDRLDEAAERIETLTGGVRAEALGEFAAHALAETGRIEEAAALLRSPVDSDSWLSPAANTMAMHNRVRFDDRAGAAALLPALRLSSGRLAVVGSGAAVGDVDFAIARGLHLLGERDEAASALERSIATLRRSQAGPWLVRALRWRWQLTGSSCDLDEARGVADRSRLPLLQRELAEER
jgi:DNA-binding SARP family transcriptional activator